MNYKYVWGFVLVFLFAVAIYASFAIVEVLQDNNNALFIEQRKTFEKAYFEGQRDALEGDFKIKKLDSKHYKWIKTPWPDTIKVYKDTIDVYGEYK